jgi:hypothetical protein
VFVVDIDVDLLAHGAAHAELNRLGVSHEVRRDVNLDAVLSQDAIRRQVLALEMHVDRHVIFCAASTNRWDEVDSGHAAALLDQRHGLLGNEQLHG